MIYNCEFVVCIDSTMFGCSCNAFPSVSICLQSTFLIWSDDIQRKKETKSTSWLLKRMLWICQENNLWICHKISQASAYKLSQKISLLLRLTFWGVRTGGPSSAGHFCFLHYILAYFLPRFLAYFPGINLLKTKFVIDSIMIWYILIYDWYNIA